MGYGKKAGKSRVLVQEDLNLVKQYQDERISRGGGGWRLEYEI